MKSVYFSVAGIILWFGLVGGIIWHAEHSKNVCHDAGGAYVGGECIRAEVINP